MGKPLGWAVLGLLLCSGCYDLNNPVDPKGGNYTPPAATLAAPGGFQAQSGDGEVTLVWDPVSGASSYNLYWSAASGVSAASDRRTKVSSGFVDTPLENGVTRYYRVSAVGPTGSESPLSAEQAATPQAGLPAAPTGLTAQATDGAVDLAWTSVPGLGYRVYRATTSSVPLGASNLVAGPLASGTSSYHDATAANGTTYYYVITAANGTGESAASAAVSALPIFAISLVAVPHPSRVSLTWSASAAHAYSVYRSTAPSVALVAGNRIASGLTTALGTDLTIAWDDPSVTNEVVYFYAVATDDGAGVSNEVQAWPRQVPDSLASLTATVTAGPAITLAWTTAPRTANNRVYRSTVAAGLTSNSNNIVAYTGADGWVDVNATPGVVYYYAVVPFNDCGDAPAPSPTASAKIPAPILTVTGATGSAGTLVLALSAVAGGDQVVAVLLHNSGDATLVVTQASLPGGKWLLATTSTFADPQQPLALSESIPPGQDGAALFLKYIPTATPGALVSGTLSLTSNDGTFASVLVEIQF